MADFLLIIVVLAIFAFGYFIMWRIDVFLDKARKERYSRRSKHEEKENEDN